jgi:hypothetical protein
VDVSGNAVMQADCGMGRVSCVARSPGDQLRAGVHDRYQLSRLDDRPAAPAEARRSALGEGFSVAALDEVIGVRDFSAWQVGLILLIFGVLVGPVNLFKWAGPGRRHRLFITTPLISLGASLVLLIYILLKDGIGGEGWRAAVVFIDGTEHMAHVRQVQMSRTGVLLGSSFTTAEPASVSLAEVSGSLLSPLEISPGNVGYGGFSRGGEGYRCSVEDGRSHGGEWFRSRSEQAHVVEAVTATRGNVEITAGADGVPSAVSRFEFPLRGLCYRDKSGQWWRAPGEVPTGDAVTLVKSTSNETGETVKGWAKPAGWSGLEPATLPDRACFVALSDDARAGLVDTLGSVRWKEQRAILFGYLP